jgi:hypothetical protein
MPIEPNPQPVTAWPNQVNIPPEDPRFFLSLQVHTDGTPSEAEADAMLQSLIDHLQEWPGRNPLANVTGSRYQSLLYLVTPTNPIPLPPGPEDPPAPE